MSSVHNHASLPACEPCPLSAALPYHDMLTGYRRIPSACQGAWARTGDPHVREQVRTRPLGDWVFTTYVAAHSDTYATLVTAVQPPMSLRTRYSLVQHPCCRHACAVVTNTDKRMRTPLNKALKQHKHLTVHSRKALCWNINRDSTVAHTIGPPTTPTHYPSTLAPVVHRGPAGSYQRQQARHPSLLLMQATRKVTHAAAAHA